MKLISLLKKACITACTVFTLLVYLLYLLRSAIPTPDQGVLPLSYLNGFLLFGAVLGLTNALLASCKLEKITKRLIHFGVTGVNFFVSIPLITGYLTAGNELHSPLAVPNRILYCMIAYVIVYFVCVGLNALVKLVSSFGKKEDEYTNVLSK